MSANGVERLQFQENLTRNLTKFVKDELEFFRQQVWKVLEDLDRRVRQLESADEEAR